MTPSTPDTSPVLTALPTRRRWREVLLAPALFLAVAFGLISLAMATGWEETLTQIAKLGWLQIFVLFALSLVNYLLRGLRWHIFARRMNLRVTILQSLRHFLGGFAMSVTPGRLGELIRLRWIARECGGRPERGAPLVLVDRASDLAAMAIILALSLSQSMGGHTIAAPVAAVALLLAIVATRPKLLTGLIKTTWKLIGRKPRFFARLRSLARSLSLFTSAAVLLPTLSLGLLGWIAEGYAFWLLLDWFGANVPFWKAVGIFTLATLAGGLTGAPGGVGGAEAAMIALLSLEGIGPGLSVPATIIIRVTTLWFAIIIGLLIFPLAEKKSRKALLNS